MLKRVKCAHCGKSSGKEAGHITRSRNAGLKLYCDRVCAGLGRRKHKTKAQKVAEKKVYDAQRRIELREELRAIKREYHKRTYDPVEAAKVRKARMPQHVEYCRRPEYKAWKREYDRRYLAEKHYGDFAEVALILGTLEGEVLSRMSRYEIALANGTLNKTTKRRRQDAIAFRG